MPSHGAATMPSLEAILHRSGFRIQQARGIRVSDGRVEIESQDARLRLEPMQAGRAGFCKAEIAFSSPELSNVTFEVEFGERDSNHRRVLQLFHVGRGRFEGLFQLPAPLTALVVHPNAVGSSLGFEHFALASLGSMERAGRLARRALSTLRRGPSAFFSALRRFKAAQAYRDVVVVPLQERARARGSYARWLARFDEDPVADESLYRERLARAGALPSFTLLVRAGADTKALEATVDSVSGQLHGEWELLVLGDPAGSVAPGRRGRVHWLASAGEADDADRLNAALEGATGDWMVPVPTGARLRPHALAELAFAATLSPDARVIYSDEDQIDPAGRRSNPRFKPDWSPDLALSWNYVGHLTAVRRDLARAIGGWRQGFDGARDYDLVLRASEMVDSSQIRHVPKILVHVPAPDEPCAPGASEMLKSTVRLRAVSEHVARLGQAADVSLDASTGVAHVAYRVRQPAPLVSIIVPTRDQVEMLKLSLASVLDKTTYGPLEVIVVDNGSTRKETLAFLEALAQDERVRVLSYPGPLNYSAINNFAVANARGEILALLNNDVEVITPSWLDEMVGHASRREVGCVGAMLYYPDDTIQHAGVTLGLGGLAGHGHKHLPRGDPGYDMRAACVCNVSAVTGACLVMKRSVYEEVGGLDEVGLAVAFNDVDLCLKVRQKGLLNIWTPFAQLYHHESVSRGADHTRDKVERFAKEIDLMKRRWGDVLLRDPYYSPNLTHSGEDYSIRN